MKLTRNTSFLLALVLLSSFAFAFEDFDLVRKSPFTYNGSSFLTKPSYTSFYLNGSTYLTGSSYLLGNTYLTGTVYVDDSICVWNSTNTTPYWDCLTGGWNVSGGGGGLTYYSDEVWINKNASDSFNFNESKLNASLNANYSGNFQGNATSGYNAGAAWFPFNNASTNVGLSGAMWSEGYFANTLYAKDFSAGNGVNATNYCIGSSCITNWTQAGNASITDNLSVSETITTKNLVITGNGTLNTFYGSVYNFSDDGWLIGIASSGVYYNLTANQTGELNGFKIIQETQANGGTKLQALYSGVYSVDGVLTGDFAGGEYGVGLVTNNTNPEAVGRCYTRTNTNDAIPIAITCLKRLNAGDNVTMVIDDESSPTKDVTVYNINFKVVRIGNLP